MTPAEIDHLAILARAGDSPAQNALIRVLDPLIRRVVSRIPMKEADIPDAIQIGRIAALQFANSWEPNKGTRFTSYLTSWLGHRISRELRADFDHVVSRPRGSSGADLQLYTLLEPASRGDTQEDGYWLDCMSHSEALQEHEAVNEQLWRLVIKNLPKNSAIAVWRWCCGSSMNEIAAIFGVSYQAIEQRLKRAFEQLRPLLADWVSSEATYRAPKTADKHQSNSQT